jgi:hypothetical protein
VLMKSTEQLCFKNSPNIKAGATHGSQHERGPSSLQVFMTCFHDRRHGLKDASISSLRGRFCNQAGSIDQSSTD